MARLFLAAPPDTLSRLRRGGVLRAEDAARDDARVNVFGRGFYLSPSATRAMHFAEGASEAPARPAPDHAPRVRCGGALARKMRAAQRPPCVIGGLSPTRHWGLRVPKSTQCT